uniref:Uncharacterized protein n=1 Tax=Arundo donax TaxID=35708 RepID=A0A0A9A019_ARUDO
MQILGCRSSHLNFHYPSEVIVCSVALLLIICLEVYGMFRPALSFFRMLLLCLKNCFT